MLILIPHNYNEKKFRVYNIIGTLPVLVFHSTQVVFNLTYNNNTLIINRNFATR